MLVVVIVDDEPDITIDFVAATVGTVGVGVVVVFVATVFGRYLLRINVLVCTRSSSTAFAVVIV